MDTQVRLAPLPAGTVLEGYTIEQALESEPNVLRYSARNAAGDRVVLVELFPSDTVIRDGLRVIVRSPEDQEGWQAWIRSFSERSRQLAALTHPGLVRLRHSFMANGTAYCAIDPVGGETLASVLERDGTLPEPRLRQVLSSLIASLDEAHSAGLLHGDIEPTRIRLQYDGKAILSGFATLVTPIRFKGHTTVNAGTPGYAPPEHLLVQAAEQPSSDIYSLAAVAYRAICGEAPPEARMRGAGVELRPSAQAVRGRYSAALTSAIDAGLVMRPLQRPQSLAQWRRMLDSEEVVASKPLQSASKKRSPMVWIAGPAALAVFAAGYLAALNGRAPVPAPPVASEQAPAAEAAAPSTAPSSATSLPTPALDQLAISMLKRGQRSVHQNLPDASAVANAPPQIAAGAAPASPSPSGQAPQVKPAAVTATAAPQPAVTQTAPKPSEATTPAAVPVAAAAPNPPSAGTSDADRLKEQQALQKAAEEEAAQQEAAAGEIAANEALAKQTAANEARDRIKRMVARAKAKCEIPSSELSENENLVYENAMAVPGASRQRDGSVRLPEVTLADGTTARFVIDSESCAHRIN